MPISYQTLQLQLRQAGLLPASKLALVSWYLLGFDIVLYALQKLFGWFRWSAGASLGGWVTFLSFVVIVLFAVLGIRWLKTKLLWRLRNRLIVTYVFIGVIPVVLLVVLALGSFYLFAGQFATFIVTTALDSDLKSLQAANSAIAHELSAGLQRTPSSESAALGGLRRSDASWAHRQVCVWLDGKLILNDVPESLAPQAASHPAYMVSAFRGIVRDRGQLYLRAAEILPANNGKLTVLSSEPLDQTLLEGLATNLGEVTLYASGLTLRKVDQTAASTAAAPSNAALNTDSIATVTTPARGFVLETVKVVRPTLSAGAVPPPARMLDRQVSFPTAISVMDWESGDTSNLGAISVQTRVSQLYQRLFESLGAVAPTIEFSLLLVAIVFGVIEAAALLIGLRLNRTITGAVAQLYAATGHVNRGDFSHRIPVRSSDQLATLAGSFNLMTESIEKLIEEQKAKQRLENELAIAQEVQAQLYPQHISQMASLEVFGFCRPARTVSGDYYDFLSMTPDKLLLAVGDVSGKGISAALLMATIHSAVRAYSLEGIPLLQEPVAAGVRTDSGRGFGYSLPGAEVSPGSLLSLLNHQLYHSTPAEKYATLFLGIYDSHQRTITYSNGGHLAPIILGDDRSLRRLDCGGTVVGLFDERSYEEATVQLHEGEILLAYSDGVTEPENEFGEFGEERLIELVRDNRDLPLAKISEIVTAAVDDWIGAHEQPDDVTLVLARAR